MAKIEDILKQKFKQSLISANREELISFGETLIDTIWEIPAERNRLIESMQISTTLSVPQTAPKKRGRKPKK